MAEKPGSKAPPTPPEQSKDSSDAGRLGKDDRGNVTWEWKEEGDLLADDEVGDAERVRALVDPKLEIVEDEDGPDNDPTSVRLEKLKKGYNPYTSGPLGKQSWKKKKNLRELSEWIELRRKMADKKKDDGG